MSCGLLARHDFSERLIVVFTLLHRCLQHAVASSSHAMSLSLRAMSFLHIVGYLLQNIFRRLYMRCRRLHGPSSSWPDVVVFMARCLHGPMSSSSWPEVVVFMALSRCLMTLIVVDIVGCFREILPMREGLPWQVTALALLLLSPVYR